MRASLLVCQEAHFTGLKTSVQMDCCLLKFRQAITFGEDDIERIENGFGKM